MSDNNHCASLVQLVERRSPKPNVRGSSPLGRARYLQPPCNQSENCTGGKLFRLNENRQEQQRGIDIVAKNEPKKSDRPEVKAKEEQSSFDLADFLKGTKEELGKIVWPSRKQLISESAGVILMVTLVATIIYLFDNLFIWIAGQVF